LKSTILDASKLIEKKTISKEKVLNTKKIEKKLEKEKKA
jgi:hypothetical protein